MKKGIVVMETLILTAVGIVLIIVLWQVLAGLLKGFISEEETTSFRDMNRIAENIRQILPNSATPVPVLSSDEVTFAIYSQDSPAIQAFCKKNTCLCYHEIIKGEKVTKCEIFPEIKKECYADKCDERELCFTGTAIAKRTQGNVYVCRSCTKIALAGTEEECKKLLG